METRDSRRDTSREGQGSNPLQGENSRPREFRPISGTEPNYNVAHRLRDFDWTSQGRPAQGPDQQPTDSYSFPPPAGPPPAPLDPIDTYIKVIEQKAPGPDPIDTYIKVIEQKAQRSDLQQGGPRPTDSRHRPPLGLRHEGTFGPSSEPSYSQGSRFDRPSRPIEEPTPAQRPDYMPQGEPQTPFPPPVDQRYDVYHSAQRNTDHLYAEWRSNPSLADDTSPTGSKRPLSGSERSALLSDSKRSRLDPGLARLQKIELHIGEQPTEFQLHYQNDSNMLTTTCRTQIHNFLSSHRDQVLHSMRNLIHTTGSDLERGNYTNLEQHTLKFNQLHTTVEEIVKGVTTVLLPNCATNIHHRRQLIKANTDQANTALENIEFLIIQADANINELERTQKPSRGLETAKAERDSLGKKLVGAYTHYAKINDSPEKKTLTEIVKYQISLQTRIKELQEVLYETEKSIERLRTLSSQAQLRDTGTTSSSRVDVASPVMIERGHTSDKEGEINEKCYERILDNFNNTIVVNMSIQMKSLKHGKYLAFSAEINYIQSQARDLYQFKELKYHNDTNIRKVSLHIIKALNPQRLQQLNDDLQRKGWRPQKNHLQNFIEEYRRCAALPQ